MQPNKSKLTAELIDTFSISFQKRTAELGFHSTIVQKYRIALEDILSSIREHFGDGSEISLVTEESSRFLVVEVRVEGEMYNPLRKKDSDGFTDFTDLILSDIGEELSYRYKKHINIIRLRLKKSNPEGWLFKKNYFAVGIPMAGQNLLGTLINCSSAMMLGFISYEELSAVSLVSQLQLVSDSVIGCICIATIVQAARQLGTGDRAEVRNSLNVGILCGLVASVLFFILAYMFPGVLMHFFTYDAKLCTYGISYLQIVAFSILLQGFTDVYLSFLRVTGVVRRVGVISLLGPLLNIVLNAVFIFGLFGLSPMGVQGAALALLISKFVQFSMVLYESRIRTNITFSFPAIFHLNRQAFVSFFGLAITETFRKLLWVLFAVASTAIMSHMGNDVITAISIVNIVISLSIAFTDGLGGTCGLFVARELGRRDVTLATDHARRGLMANMAISVVIGLLLIPAIPPILQLYGQYPPATLSLLSKFLVIVPFIPVIRTFTGTTAVGFFSAGKDYRYSFWLDLIIYWGVVLPLALICSHCLSEPAFVVFAILNFGYLFRVLPVLLRFKSGKWIHLKSL